MTAFNPTRRTVARGAAWAVPVIAFGAAAPKVAASPVKCFRGCFLALCRETSSRYNTFFLLQDDGDFGLPLSLSVSVTKGWTATPTTINLDKYNVKTYQKIVLTRGKNAPDKFTVNVSKNGCTVSHTFDIKDC